MARTRAQDYDDKRNSILRTSAQVFAEEGYDRSSMSKIADACHVSKALLYHYYDNKEQILNWKYMWFKEGGPLAREEYARIATTLIINGARGL